MAVPMHCSSSSTWGPSVAGNVLSSGLRAASTTPSICCHHQPRLPPQRCKGLQLSSIPADNSVPGQSHIPRRAVQANTYSTDAYNMGPNSSSGGPMDTPAERMGEAARKALARATTAVKRYGWISFWVQLTLSVVSAVILLFSVAFTSQSGPRASLYLTLIGILAGFLSTFWNLGYTRTGLKMQRYLESPPGANVPKIKKQTVVDLVTRGCIINLLGLGSTLLGIQALVGVLVAKTLSNATANPFIASAAGVYNPVLALDVFLVQAATNMLLGHFLSLVCSLWLLSVVGEGRGLRFQRFLSLQRLKMRAEQSKLVIGKGNAATFTINADEGPRGGRGGGGTARARASLTSGFESARTRTSALLQRTASGAQGAASSARTTPPLVSSLGGPTAASMQAGLVRGGRAGWDLVRAPAPMQALTSSATALAALPASPPASNTTQWGSKVRVATPAALAASSGAGPLRVRRNSSRSLDRARSALGLQAASKRAASGEMLVLADANSLAYLDGSLPGDMGFDPLGLFSPECDAGFINQRWLRYAEVIHGRWACLGVVGCLAPEVLAYERIIPKEHGVVWFKTGFLPPAGQQYDFGMDPVSLTWIMLVAMAFAECRRLQDFLNPGSLATGHHLPLVLDRALSTPPGCDPVYPGGPIFNFLGVVESESATSLFKEKELKHGRLAMVAMLGLFAQAAATHDGPYINLLDHLFDPLGENILTNLNDINE